MGRRKKAKPDDKDESIRFVDAAKNLQDEEAKARFDKLCSTVLKPKKQKPN